MLTIIKKYHHRQVSYIRIYIYRVDTWKKKHHSPIIVFILYIYTKYIIQNMPHCKIHTGKDKGGYGEVNQFQNTGDRET